MISNTSCHEAQTESATALQAPGLGDLRRQAVREAVGHWGVLLVFFGVLHALAALHGLVPGAIGAAVVLVAVHGLLGYRLSEYRRSASCVPASRLGTANRLTLLRGLLISLTAGFLVVRPGDGSAFLLAWLPGGLYLTAAVLDGIDGAWARRTGTESRLGKSLDGDVDALGVLVACSVAVASGRLPAYYLVAGVVYYGYQLGLWRRRRKGRSLHPAPPRRFARIVAGFQMGFLAAALLPVFSTEVLAVAAPVFLLPLLAGFVRDWVHVRGGFDGRLTLCWRALRARLSVLGPKGVRLVLLGAVTGLFVWAWRDVSPAAVLSAIGLWKWPQWILFAGVNLVILGAMCWRWWLILRRMGHPIPFAALVPYRMAANTVSYITPGPQFGGEPLQVLCLAERHGMPPAAATAAVGVDRLTELMGNLVFLSICGVFILPPLIGARSALIWTALGTSAVVLAVGRLLYGIARGGAPLSRMAAWAARGPVLRGHPSRWIAFLQAGEQSAAAILTDRLAGWYGAIGAVQWMAFLAELWAIYHFLGFSMTLQALLTVAVAARLAFLLPLPGGLGALEAGQVLALVSLGGTPDLAAAACAVMRLRDIVLMAMGGVFAARWLGLGRPREATPADVAETGRGP